jgi:hypothetical protein
MKYLFVFLYLSLCVYDGICQTSGKIRTVVTGGRKSPSMSVSNPENIFKYKFKCPDGKNEIKIETIEYKNGEKLETQIRPPVVFDFSDNIVFEMHIELHEKSVLKNNPPNINDIKNVLFINTIAPSISYNATFYSDKYIYKWRHFETNAEQPEKGILYPLFLIYGESTDNAATESFIKDKWQNRDFPASLNPDNFKTINHYFIMYYSII